MFTAVLTVLQSDQKHQTNRFLEPKAHPPSLVHTLKHLFIPTQPLKRAHKPSSGSKRFTSSRDEALQTRFSAGFTRPHLLLSGERTANT